MSAARPSRDLPLQPAPRNPLHAASQPARDPVPSPGRQRERRQAGALSHLSGRAAEDQVAAHYTRGGACLLASRWRGGGGEIDLILTDGARYIFVEVKRARYHDRALERITVAQTARLFSAAQVFLDGTPDRGLSQTRFDVATVDGSGDIRVIENAFA